MSIALIWFPLVADIFITSPPSDFTSELASLSGSTIITSALGSFNIIETISSFAMKLFPLPLTPRIKLFPFNNCFLSAIIIFLLMTFCP